MINNASEDCINFWLENDHPKYQGDAAISSFVTEVSKGCIGKVFPSPLDSIRPQFDYFLQRNNRYDDPIVLHDPKKLTESVKYSVIIPYFHKDDGKNWFIGIFEFLSHMHNFTRFFFMN